jgi:hypothetical protein
LLSASLTAAVVVFGAFDTAGSVPFVSTHAPFGPSDTQPITSTIGAAFWFRVEGVWLVMLAAGVEAATAAARMITCLMMDLVENTLRHPRRARAGQG